MRDFTFYNPTRIEFGKGKENNIGEYVQSFGLDRVLILYGSERIKRDGLFDRVANSLTDKGIALGDISRRELHRLDHYCHPPLAANSSAYDSIRCAVLIFCGVFQVQPTHTLNSRTIPASSVTRSTKLAHLSSASLRCLRSVPRS